MKSFLSVIIPAYNCAATLKTAVDSVYAQNLTLPFEVVIVDDGSTDKTPEIISSLKELYPHLISMRHESNLGGGAARNTAVLHAHGNLLFCLDSDDIMGSNMLNPMIKKLGQEKLDGVTVQLSKKFIGNNPSRFAYINNFQKYHRLIPPESLFSQEICPLFLNFLYTRRAFNIIGGYPVDHGFDTQAFGFAFLANGLKASVCQSAIYLHRVNYGRSYYIREWESGHISENWLKIFEAFFYLFSDQVKLKLMTCNLHTGGPDLYQLIRSSKQIFIPEYKQLLVPHTQIKYQHKILSKANKTIFELYWLGIQYYQNGEYRNSLDTFSRILNQGIVTNRIKLKFLAAAAATAGLQLSDLAINLQPSEKTMDPSLQLFLLRKRNDLFRFLRQFI